MSKRRFTKDQLTELSKNEFVERCSEKSITYSKAFKVLAVKRYEEGCSSVQIFRDAGFHFGLVGDHIPDDRMSDWRKIYRMQGEKGLLTENRGKTMGGKGGRPRIHGVTDAEKIERLEATVAYLKAENSFLAKLRAKRRE
jgi:transposase-like protein